MNIILYYEILKWREEDPHKTDDTTNPPQQVGVSIFQKDILLNKAVWTNRKGKDFKYWLQSFHPLFGLISSPKCHPYSKQYRLANISLLLSIGAVWSILSCFYTHILLNIDSIGDRLEFLKLLLISFTNYLLLYFIEWLFVKTQCFKHCFKLIVSIPGCILITIPIISMLGSMVIVVELDFVAHFVFIYPIQFVMLWLFQIFFLYLSFTKHWNFDRKLMESDNYQRDSTTFYNNNNNTDNVSMVSGSTKNPYYVTFKDYQEFIAQRGVDNMDISISNDDSISNNLVLGYTPPTGAKSVADPLFTGNSL